MNLLPLLFAIALGAGLAIVLDAVYFRIGIDLLDRFERWRNELSDKMEDLY